MTIAPNSTITRTGSRIARPRYIRPRIFASGLGTAAAAAHGDLAGADHLDQAEGPDHVLEGLDLVVGARDLDGHRAARHVHGLAAEDVRELHDLGARVS